MLNLKSPHTNGLAVNALAYLVALGFACIVFGAIPWLGLPTLGQAVWASGFAESFANAGPFSVYAVDFGLPKPAPISFGLSATLIQSLFARLPGLSVLDAYTLTVVLFLAIALHGAAAFARALGASFMLSLLIGLLWLCLPFVWGHAAYSMLALGFALLPFYVGSAFAMLHARDSRSYVFAAALFCANCILSIFMDGYTFVMFVVACMIFCAGSLAEQEISWRRVLFRSLPTMALGFVGAVLLYLLYIGWHRYETSDTDFFRGFGLDTTMLIEPTRGVYWLWDVLGLSVARNSDLFWGDASVWLTTFSLPLLLSGIAGYLLAKRRVLATTVLVVALVGLYLSLGPSLKIDSTKEVAGIQPTETGLSMPAKYAVMPTGSAWISENLPGFREMRAAYRWIGLGALGLWLLSAFLLAGIEQRRRTLACSIAAVLIVCFLPHLIAGVRASVSNRQKANALTTDLVPDLKSVAGGRSKVVFVPYGNDFIVNYLAPVAGFKSYNVGGDKNLLFAKSGWNERMKRLDGNRVWSPGFVDDLRMMLVSGDADLIILPYFNPLWAAHNWPPPAQVQANGKNEMLSIARSVVASSCIELHEFVFFSALELTPSGRTERDRLLAGDGAAQSLPAACVPDH